MQDAFRLLGFGIATFKDGVDLVLNFCELLVELANLVLDFILVNVFQCLDIDLILFLCLLQFVHNLLVLPDKVVLQCENVLVLLRQLRLPVLRSLSMLSSDLLQLLCVLLIQGLHRLIGRAKVALIPHLSILKILLHLR